MKPRSWRCHDNYFGLLTGLLFFALLTGGCSTFNRDWKKAVATPGAADTVEGCWEGTWLSARNGHTGKLRCLATKTDDRQIRARFKATYWKIFRIGYEVTLNSESLPGDKVHIQGENDLGWWGGGVYHYSGTISPTNFSSTYRSKYDHGTFEMKRPGPE